MNPFKHFCVQSNTFDDLIKLEDWKTYRGKNSFLTPNFVVKWKHHETLFTFSVGLMAMTKPKKTFKNQQKSQYATLENYWFFCKITTQWQTLKTNSLVGLAISWSTSHRIWNFFTVTVIRWTTEGNWSP